MFLNNHNYNFFYLILEIRSLTLDWAHNFPVYFTRTTAKRLLSFCLGNLTAVLEGVTVGILVAVVLFLLCLIFIKRRRYWNKPQTKKDYTRLEPEPPSVDFLEDRKEDTRGFAPSEYSLVQPPRPEVTWAVPECQPKRERSVSCPDRRRGFSELSPKTEEKKSSETPSSKRKSRRYRRSKTDSCYHVCQLQFTAFYNYYHSKLTLQLVCAVNIPSTFGLNYGSYIEVELEPSTEKYTTRTQLHTNNPVFDESAEFLDISSEELLDKAVKLRLYTVDRFSHSTLVGQVRAPLAELDFNPQKPTTIWRPITPQDQVSDYFQLA